MKFCFGSNFFKGTYSSKRKFDATVNPEYMFVDLNKLSKDKISMTNVNFENHWKLEDSIEDMALYVRNDSKEKGYRLIEKSSNPFKEKDMVSIALEDALSLESVEFSKNISEKRRIYPVVLYWISLKKTKINYEMSFNVLLNKKSKYKKNRIIGNSIYPTSTWLKGEYIKESYSYLLPKLDAGEYLIEIDLINPNNKKSMKRFNEKFIVE